VSSTGHFLVFGTARSAPRLTVTLEPNRRCSSAPRAWSTIGARALPARNNSTTVIFDVASRDRHAADMQSQLNKSWGVRSREEPTCEPDVSC
jgi:hypothetical protein